MFNKICTKEITDSLIKLEYPNLDNNLPNLVDLQKNNRVKEEGILSSHITL